MVAARQKYYYAKMYNFYKTVEENWTLRCLNELNSRERERDEPFIGYQSATSTPEVKHLLWE